MPRTGSRVAQRQAKRSKQRRLLALLLAIAVIVLAVATVALSRRDTPARATLPPQTRTQSTLFFQVQGESGAAVGSALMAHDPASRSGAVVLVPPQVIVTVPGTGTLQLGRALRSVPSERSRSALADLMGVTVDAGWVINIPTLAALIDKLGGVRVDVDVPVIAGQTVVLSPGGQVLDGANATQFLRYLATGEQEQSRLARLQEVIDGLLAALPTATGQVTDTLSRLGNRSDSSLPAPQLAAFLVGLAGDTKNDQVQYDTLPVIPIDPGDGVTSFRLDAPATQSLVDRLLAQSVPPGVRATGNRVLVLNGVGTPGLGEKVRAKLVPAGFVFVGSRNNATFGVARSRVLVKDSSAEAQALGARLAKALGLPADAVQTADLGSIADAIVVVGGDFRAS